MKWVDEHLYLQVKKDIQALKKPSKTKDVRNLAKKYKKIMLEIKIDRALVILEELIKSKLWAEKIFSFQIAYDLRVQYHEKVFDVFERWVLNYIEDWWDTDDFMTHAFGSFLIEYPQFYSNIKKWTKGKHFAIRRSSAVVLILPIKKKQYAHFNLFEICDALLNDPHDLVKKGYGWLLKVASTNGFREEVIQYVIKHVDKMPRVSFRYAIENLDIKTKQRLMKL